MTTGATPASIVNQALQEIAAQASVTGTNPTFDGSAAGNAAGILYTPAVNLLLRQQDYEFSHTEAILSAAATTPPLPWGYAYLYPSDCMKVRQIFPATWNVNDPQPVRWAVQTVTIAGVATEVILTNVAAANISYTTNLVTEAEFDAVFQETLVRFLASELAMALGGRPDFSEKMLEQAGALTGEGKGLDS